MSTTTPSLATRTFVLGMVHRDGRLVAAELYDVGAAAGFTVHQIRLCLARLVADGLFQQTGRGRRAVLEPTTTGLRRIEPEPGFLRLAFEQDAGLVPWDGHWHVVAFTMGESRRAERNALREQLLRMGGAPIGTGAYVCANDWTDLVVETTAELEVTDGVVLARTDRLIVGADADPRRIAARLWPLDEIAEGWRRFTAERRRSVERVVRGSRAPTAGREVLLANVIDLVAAFERCMEADPLLPPELLPSPWPGRAGRALLLRAARATNAVADLGPSGLFGRFEDVIADALAARPP